MQKQNCVDVIIFHSFKLPSLENPSIIFWIWTNLSKEFWSINLSFAFYLLLSIMLFWFLSLFHSSIFPLIYSFTLSVYSLFHLFLFLTICPSIHKSICWFICSFFLFDLIQIIFSIIFLYTSSFPFLHCILIFSK